MLFKKMWRTVGVYRAQFISMIIMITLGIGIFVGFNMEWVSIKGNTDSFFKKTGYADYRVMSEASFKDEDVKKILSIDGVDDAARFVSAAVDVKEREGDTLSLAVTTNAAVSGMLVTEGDAYDKNSENGVWLSDKYASANDFSLGDSITLKYKNIKISGTVKGLIKSGEFMICVRDESQIMPDFSTHGFAYISPVMYEKVMGMAYYPQINIISGLEKSELVKAVDSSLGVSTPVLTKDESGPYAGAKGEIEEGQNMGSVLPVLFLLIAVLTMVTTMHRLAAKEKVQIGTLKALGFKDKRIIRHYSSYAFVIGVIGSLLGTLLGYLVAWMIMNPDGMMGTYMDIDEWHLYFPWFCYVVLAGIIVLLTLIGYLSVKSMLYGTPADALRPYTPRKNKPMLIEKTAFFHKLSFGTRWNMRDIVRHKSRTAMSFIGVIGCMVIVIAALGMRDTMSVFLQTYYNDATNYSSRIYFSEDATDLQREEIKDKYSGDTSMTLSVQLEEKAVSLDVYDISGDKVRFPKDKSNEFVSIKDGGVYICRRIADEFSLSQGDSLTFSPFGSDEMYTVKVLGIIRSVTESMVMTPGTYESLGLDFKPDSVYTDTDKNNIPAGSAIKSVQSKQMIIDSFDTFTELMDMMIYLLIGGALLLGVVVLYNLGVMSYTERYREMATLKVVGFRNNKIGRLLIGQNLFISIVGSVIGLPLGILILDYLLKKLAGEYETELSISPFSCVLSLVLTVGMSLAVGFTVAGKNRRIDMVEALKCAE